MNELLSQDSKLCRIRLSKNAQSLIIKLSLEELPLGQFSLSVSDRFTFDVNGLDEQSRDYALSNWKGGIISGARYAFRILKAPVRQVRLHELRGHLGSEDVQILAAATSLAVARLLGKSDNFQIDLDGWNLEEEFSQHIMEQTHVGTESELLPAIDSSKMPEQHPTESTSQIP